MAVVSAGINAMATAALMDFGRQHPVSTDTDQKQLRLARGLTLSFGILATGLALVIGKLGTLIQITITIMGIFGGPLLGIFLLGVLVSRANSFGALTGACAGTLIGVAIGFPQTFLKTDISFMWVGICAAATTIVVGWGASHFGKSPTLEQQRLVYKQGVVRAASCK